VSAGVLVLEGSNREKGKLVGKALVEHIVLGCAWYCLPAYEHMSQRSTRDFVQLSFCHLYHFRDRETVLGAYRGLFGV
jgi:hypothetical protein